MSMKEERFMRYPLSEEHRTKQNAQRALATMVEIVWRDNVWGSPEEDANRRDFTVNALFLDPLNDNKIIDYCNGTSDISDKKVRSLEIQWFVLQDQ